ncbi:gp575 [Bacillus phage G]|uniref:Gp575 n=1 Tax=Bacillus phage G TaxID=2884420 RepID=G3MAV5_9CAUD|nr:gp575 [Bacillus phage G]AEO93943.1 gp575 [Bacillus phage G]
MELILAAALLVILIMLIQTVKRKNLKEKRLNEQ